MSDMNGSAPCFYLCRLSCPHASRARPGVRAVCRRLHCRRLAPVVAEPLSSPGRLGANPQAPLLATVLTQPRHGAHTRLWRAASVESCSLRGCSTRCRSARGREEGPVDLFVDAELLELIDELVG